MEAEFGKMEADAEKVAPGIMGVLIAYGRHEEAVKQADEYFAALTRTCKETTSNHTGG